eukprot:1204908-Prymnesium_polylepis.2
MGDQPRWLLSRRFAWRCARMEHVDTLRGGDLSDAQTGVREGRADRARGYLRRERVCRGKSNAAHVQKNAYDS